MLTPDQVKAQLADRKVNVVAAETGLHPATIRRVINDPEYMPSLRTLMLLIDYLTGGKNG
jgi:hypothetical protein